MGLAAFCAVLVAWARQAWSLATRVDGAGLDARAGVLMLAVMVNYLCSAMFHDLTLLPAQEMMLFLFAGVTVNLRQSGAVRVSEAKSASG